MALTAGEDEYDKIPVSSPMIPRLRVLVAAPVVGVPPELEELAVGAEPTPEVVPVDADFEEELHAAAPATSSAAPRAHIAFLALNTFIIYPPLVYPNTV
jgi:hypothetical protein